MWIDWISCPCIWSPLSHMYPALSENLQQHAAACRAAEVCLCLRSTILSIRMLVCVFVCSKDMIFLWVEIIYAPHLCLNISVCVIWKTFSSFSFLLYLRFTRLISFSSCYLLWFILHHMRSGNFEFVIGAYEFATPNLTLLLKSERNIFFTSFFYKVKIPTHKPQNEKWQCSIQTVLSNKERNVKAKASSRISAKRTSAAKTG